MKDFGRALNVCLSAMLCSRTREKRPYQVGEEGSLSVCVRAVSRCMCLLGFTFELSSMKDYIYQPSDTMSFQTPIYRYAGAEIIMNKKKDK